MGTRPGLGVEGRIPSGVAASLRASIRRTAEISLATSREKCPSICLPQIGFLTRHQKLTRQSSLSLIADAHTPVWKYNDHSVEFETERRILKEHQEMHNR